MSFGMMSEKTSPALQGLSLSKIGDLRDCTKCSKPETNGKASIVNQAAGARET